MSFHVPGRYVKHCFKYLSQIRSREFRWLEGHSAYFKRKGNSSRLFDGITKFSQVHYWGKFLYTYTHMYVCVCIWSYVQLSKHLCDSFWNMRYWGRLCSRAFLLEQVSRTLPCAHRSRGKQRSSQKGNICAPSNSCSTSSLKISFPAASLITQQSGVLSKCLLHKPQCHAQYPREELKARSMTKLSNVAQRGHVAIYLEGKKCA